MGLLQATSNASQCPADNCQALCQRMEETWKNPGEFADDTAAGALGALLIFVFHYLVDVFSGRKWG
jgi:ATP/maltotriose-dependent transcriptional regulator MalT